MRLKYATSHNPCVFSSMLHDASPDAGVGDLVHVYTKRGEYFGRGLYDPLAKMALRVYHHHNHHHDQLEGGDADHEFGEAGLTQLVQSAVDLRTKVLVVRVVSYVACRVGHNRRERTGCDSYRDRTCYIPRC